MPTMISAAESTANVNTSQHVRDVSETLAYLDPDVAPFTLVTMKAKKEVADNFKFEWAEKSLRSTVGRINNGAGYTAGSTSIVVDDGSIFRIRDLVEHPASGETMLVTNVATHTLTVTRSVGAVAAASITDNDDLFIIGSAFAEGAAVGTEKEWQETWVYNYTQIFRDPFGETRTQQNTKNYLGTGRVRLRKEMAAAHRIHIEQAFLFGEISRSTASTAAPFNTTGGFLEFATANTKAAGGALSEAEVWDWCEDLFAHTGGSSTRVLYTSAIVSTVIDMLAGARLQTVPKDDTYGIAVKQWVTSHGTLMIVKHRLLIDGANGDGYAGYALATEPSKLGYRYLANSDTQLLTDRQAPGDDKWTDEYLSEVGLEFRNPDLHGVLTGVTG